jgi:hypothetical protein
MNDGVFDCDGDYADSQFSKIIYGKRRFKKIQTYKIVLDGKKIEISEEDYKNLDCKYNK